MQQRFLTVRQTADYLGLTVQAVYQRVHRGTIPYVKWGKAVRFDVQKLNALMTKHSQEAA